MLLLVASSSAITLQRELLEAIAGKFSEIDHNDLKWPSLESRISTPARRNSGAGSPLPGRSVAMLGNIGSDSDDEPSLRTYWDTVKAKHASGDCISGELPNLDILPSEWAVVSISVTDDRNTMLVSRHQKDHDPLVFCLPLDRQGRRDGEEDLFTFDAAVTELGDIISSSDEAARAATSVQGSEGKAAWWANRKALDKRMEELLSNLEFCWLGAFKVSLPLYYSRKANLDS